MANAAQNLKTRATNARTANATAIKAQHDAAIARLTVLLTAAADTGLETYGLPETHEDYAIWQSAAGQAYIVGRGFTVTDARYVDGRVLEISWVSPSNVP